MVALVHSSTDAGMQIGFCTTLTHLPDTPTLCITEDVLSRPHEVLERVGKGAFGEVFKYTEEQKRYSVALKCLPIHDNVLMEVNDIIKEVAVHSALLHKNIVHYVGCYRGRDHLAIFLEYMERGSLKDKLSRLERARSTTGYDNLWKLVDDPILPCKTIMRYSFDVISGLNFLHSKKIIHRDIRSPNILISANDVAKISDFGLCKEIHALSTNSGYSVQHNIGNVFFRAPEMIDTREQTRCGGRAVDIWSLGIMILEMVYHVPPFAREKGGEIPYMYKLCVHKDLPDIPYFLSDDVKRLLSRCLVFSPDERASTAELLEEFFADLYEVGQVEEDRADPSPPRPKRRQGMGNLWNLTCPPPRVRKVGLHHTLSNERNGDNNSNNNNNNSNNDGQSSTSSGDGSQLRVRRTAVCHSPQEMTDMLLY